MRQSEQKVILAPGLCLCAHCRSNHTDTDKVVTIQTKKLYLEACEVINNMQKNPENLFLSFRIQMHKMYCGGAYFLRTLKLVYLMLSGKRD